MVQVYLITKKKKEKDITDHLSQLLAWTKQQDKSSSSPPVSSSVFSLRGRAEAGGAFPHKQTRTDSSGVPGTGCPGDGTISPREQGHATLPKAGTARLDQTWRSRTCTCVACRPVYKLWCLK